MNESSVSSPLMEKLRRRLTDSEVIKHHDASTIGIPDCSVTYRKRTFWIEFKLWRPPVTWSEIPFAELANERPTQWALCKRLARISYCWYIIWVKKSKRVTLFTPIGEVLANTTTTSEMVEVVAQLVEGLV